MKIPTPEEVLEHMADEVCEHLAVCINNKEGHQGDLRYIIMLNPDVDDTEVLHEVQARFESTGWCFGFRRQWHQDYEGNAFQCFIWRNKDDHVPALDGGVIEWLQPNDVEERELTNIAIDFL